MRAKLLKRKTSLAAIIFVTCAAVSLAIPAIGQSNPESLLPPGFGDPAPPAPPASPGTAVPPPPSSGPPTTVPTASATPGVDADSPTEDDDEDDDEPNEVEMVFDVPPAARRSLANVGLISESEGGYGADVFGQANGAFLNNILRRTAGPLASRWGSIITRRMLASRTQTPRNIAGNDWVAERAWLLLRMGDAVVARQLVQKVDASNYSERLYEVAMQSFLANGDLSGVCPLSEGGARTVGNPAWKMSRPLCASLAGEQGRATGLLNQARSQGWMRGIDYLLAEKAVGAGTNGRRAVKIEWEKVEGLNTWRHGVAQATGVEPPELLYQSSGRHIDGWRVTMPMLSVQSRMKVATGAAALGVLSNRAMVDLYAQALDDPDAGDVATTSADLLESAYTAAGSNAKVSAMAGLWDSSKDNRALSGNLVLTARAAALIGPSSDHVAHSDRLIASMLSAGFDRQAARWSNVVDNGSIGWGLLAVGAPGNKSSASYGDLDDFYSNDKSDKAHKSRLLLAGLVGLGRVESGASKEFASDLSFNVARETKWSRAIAQAAERGERGTVVLLTAAGLQADSWTKVPASHLYHIVASLRKVGMDAEARMIAAEAVTFG